MPIFRVKSVKIYTGQKKITRTPSSASLTNIRYVTAERVLIFWSINYMATSNDDASLIFLCIIKFQTLFYIFIGGGQLFSWGQDGALPKPSNQKLVD